MASDEVEIEKSDKELKNLGFVSMFAMNSLVVASSLYENAKQSSGPLKSVIGTAENAVTTTVGPVYENFKDVPGDLIVFLDQKVDEATTKFEEIAPALVKNVVSQAQTMVQTASQVAQSLVKEALAGGLYAAIYFAWTLAKQFIFTQLAWVWYEVNRCPLLHVVAGMVLPIVALLAETYNKVVSYMAANVCIIFSYVPLVPVSEMAKAYEQQVEAAARKEGGVAISAESEADKD
ncbi:unnamed protein product [Ilex paraguariensis]|uniref:Uncharacterized protein n=1 Tax=Ilex paraguariensis TaxID=185542 RepID=A0ABC8QXY1_9AQUA